MPRGVNLSEVLGIFDEEHMKFSTVEIRPGGNKRDKWEVRFADLDGDRVNEGYGPHSLGTWLLTCRTRLLTLVEEDVVTKVNTV